MEKGGGKGFSSTPKSKEGRTVHFDSEGSPDFDLPSKSSSKSDANGLKGNLGKGGKGDKVANGGKTKVTKEQPPTKLNFDSELPKNAKCLMDCEASQILQGIQEQMVLLSQDPTIKLPVSFDKGLQYAKTGAHYTNPQSVRRVLERLTEYGVSKGEICVIAKVFPETADEVFSLIPSLKSISGLLEGPLTDALDELAKYRMPA